MSFVQIEGQSFELLDLSGSSKYSTDEYIGKTFGTDVCLYYLGKNNKGHPYIVVKCILCNTLREVNAYNLGKKTLKKCHCCNSRKSTSEKRVEYLKYIDKTIYGLKIKNLRQHDRFFYFQGYCKHNNAIEVEVTTFLERKGYKCNCCNEKNKFSDDYIVRSNYRWFERLKSCVGNIVDNKKIIALKDDITKIDVHKQDAYRNFSFHTKCLICGRYLDVVAYDAYLRIQKPEKVQKRNLRRCICQRSFYMDDNFIGQVFGRLKVENIEYNEEKGEVLWNCTCMCKENTKVRAIASTIYKGNRKSCGCLRRESIQNNSPYLEDKYIGKIYGQVNGEGGLKVLSIDTDSKKWGIQWDCECLFCHDIVKLPAGQVVKGELQSCGCHHTENTTFYKDRKFIGQTFNDIEVLDILENKGRGYVWKCKCPYCENEFEELGSKIFHERRISCGCQHGSYYENYISYLLNKLNILYRKEVSFKGLIGKNNKPLRYDFGIYSVNSDKILYLIEYDGLQHFDVNAQIKVKSKEEAEEKLKGIQERDKKKNEFAIINNIPLKRFNKDNIGTIEDFLKNLKRTVDSIG